MIEPVQIPKNLEIRFISDEVGYGMITTDYISKGDVVEMCYCIIHKNENVNWILNDYLFDEFRFIRIFFRETVTSGSSITVLKFKGSSESLPKNAFELVSAVI